ncbi:hypothetical protein HPP92_004747 [Vanilla planifolia]|uniref:Uncharacterized protein n=1 Tax=Vanilla planifolia TaxID=51239 RepID=A0A835RMB5_VANPL|nr:hypothetical protein HPP92_005097 [Vanilla planifolia]KAG0493753.1 hypothetical protein HPP92_004747 [Vanilla planifolia]
MSEAYERVKAGRLAFKGGELAAFKSIDKKKRKKKKHKLADDALADADGGSAAGEGEGASSEAGDVYTIDAAKKMKYEELFPVETKKFGYDPANLARSSARTVEEALDDRVKKKADRYCK